MARKIDREKWNEKLRAIGLGGRLPDALTERVLDAVRGRPLGERYTLPDGEVPGLYLDVSADGGALFMLAYRTTEGVRRQHKIARIGEVPLKDARALAQRTISAVKGGADPVEERRTARQEQRAASETVRAYLENVYWPHKLRHRKNRNGEIAKAHILASWAPVLDVPLAELTRENIAKVLADRKALTRKDGSRRVADGTLLRDWNPFRAMLADAVDRGHLAAMPVTRRPDPIRGLRDEPRIRWLGEHDSEEEIAKGEGERARFFKALDAFQSDEPGGGDFLRTVVRLALNTGMRRGEIVRLTEKMIKLREGRIDLPGAICKGGKGRPVHLNADAIAALKAWKLRGKDGELFPGEGKREEVAERYEDRVTQRECPRLCEQAGITNFTFHDTRHTFAALLVKAGVPLIEVRDALGHQSIVVTERHYAHLSPSSVRRSVQALRVS